MLYKKFDEAVEQETEQSLPDSEKIVRLSEIFGVRSDCLLKGEESDPMEIYSQHSSKAGADMSAEVGEILEHMLCIVCVQESDWQSEVFYCWLCL